MDAVIINWVAVASITGVIVATAAASKWSYGALTRYFEGLSVKKSFGSRLATVESDVKEIKLSVATLVSDSKVNGGASAKDQNNRIEAKLDRLLEES